MNDLEIKHLQDNLAAALAEIVKLKADNHRLNSNLTYYKTAKPKERSGDFNRVKDSLYDAREDLKEAKAMIALKTTSVELWKSKYLRLRGRVEDLTKNLNKGD